ncbi:MAG: Hsp33 family molecular chaperone HslO [Methylophilales bacterium]|nr:Hsp33 family molecular chaperone HslO [Methylophilales bacterium]
MQDQLSRFIFENTPIRGEVVRLEATWQSVLERHDYPVALRHILGELMAAAALLTATLKLDGALVLQIQGDGLVSLLVVECNSDMTMRATAKWSDELPVEESLDRLVGNGKCVITLLPSEGQSYQGVVPLEGDSIAEIISGYMARSEQLDTVLWLASNDRNAAGMLLQKLPDQPLQDDDDWNRITQLGGTVKPHELLELSAQTLLKRLFFEEDVRLFEPQEVTFSCPCSRAGVANVLRMLGKEEIAKLVDERKRIEVHCEFCNQRYEFDKIDAEQLFVTDIAAPGGETRH